MEVNDADGTLLGDEYSGKTLYFHRLTTELSVERPSGWVRMQVRSFAVFSVLIVSGEKWGRVRDGWHF